MSKLSHHALSSTSTLYQDQANTGKVTLTKSAIFLLPDDHNAITSEIGTVDGNMKFKFRGDRLNA